MVTQGSGWYLSEGEKLKWGWRSDQKSCLWCLLDGMLWTLSLGTILEREKTDESRLPLAVSSRLSITSTKMSHKPLLCGILFGKDFL